jgi:hypothetical protein
MYELILINAFRFIEGINYIRCALHLGHFDDPL